MTSRLWQSSESCLFTLAHWWVLWYLNMRETPIRPKELLTSSSSNSFWHTTNQNNHISRYPHVLLSDITNLKYYTWRYTSLGKVSKGQRLLVFALRQQCYGNTTTDSLQLVGTLAVLAKGPEHLPHALPVLLYGTKLSGRNIRFTITNLFPLGWIEGVDPIDTRTNLYFHNSMGQIQVLWKGDIGGSPVFDKERITFQNE